MPRFIVNNYIGDKGELSDDWNIMQFLGGKNVMPEIMPIKNKACMWKVKICLKILTCGTCETMKWRRLSSI